MTVLALQGKVTGGGWINIPTGKGSFGFVVRRETLGGPVLGQLQYTRHGSNVSIYSVSFLTLVIEGNVAHFSGICAKKGSADPCTFFVRVEDNDEPGRGKDRFEITIVVSGGPYLDGFDAPIAGGNIKIHKDSVVTLSAAPSVLATSAGGDTTVAGSGAGVFPEGADLNGIRLSGLQFGQGMLIFQNGSAIGDFEALLAGTTILGEARNVSVDARISGGALNPDGSVTLSGLATLDFGAGSLPLVAVPISVVATTDGLTLTIGATTLPAATLTEGALWIQ